MATETTPTPWTPRQEGEPPTPYDKWFEETPECDLTGEAFHMVTHQREGYLRAMQDRTIRESHHRLLEILALVCEEGITTRNLNNALETIAQAEALEKGAAS